VDLPELAVVIGQQQRTGVVLIDNEDQILRSSSSSQLCGTRDNEKRTQRNDKQGEEVRAVTLHVHDSQKARNRISAEQQPSRRPLRAPDFIRFPRSGRAVSAELRRIPDTLSGSQLSLQVAAGLWERNEK
jgi:hypothetical protein